MKKESAMRRICTFAVLAGLFVLCVVPGAAADRTVTIAVRGDIGPYLTDDEGMTLYLFKRDTPGVSACTTESCATCWPPFYREQVAPPAGLSAGDFATIYRPDGARQTTFRGYPLYYYKGDVSPGETNGNEMMDLWYVVTPGNFPPR